MEQHEVPAIVYFLTGLWLLTAFAGFHVLPGSILLANPTGDHIWNEPDIPYVHRILQQAPPSSGGGNSGGIKFPPAPVMPPFPPAPPGYTFPLAQNSTTRPDPLSGLNLYIGGWNLTNQHYWAVSGVAVMRARVQDKVNVLWSCHGYSKCSCVVGR